MWTADEGHMAKNYGQPLGAECSTADSWKEIYDLSPREAQK